MPICPALDGPESFAPGMMAYLDCQAQTLGAQGYQALAMPGSIAGQLLTAMTTLLIALIGYRLLLGYTLSIRDGVLTAVKIGLIFALATNWPAYQVVIYDVILRSPAQIAASIGGAAQLPGATGGLAQHLDGVDQALKILAIQGVGSPPLGADDIAQMRSVAPPPFLNFDNFALGWSRVGFLVSALVSFALVRLVAGILLALGPLFIAFLLFDGTRGLFEGWARALIGSALAALATMIVLGVELAFFEPWLSQLLARRSAGLDILGVPAQILAATVIFSIGLLATIIVIGRVAMSLNIPAWHSFGHSRSTNMPQLPHNLSLHSNGMRESEEQRNRAAAIADAVAITQRREGGPIQHATSSSMAAVSAPVRQNSDSLTASALSSASNASKRNNFRTSARAMNRDRMK